MSVNTRSKRLRVDTSSQAKGYEYFDIDYWFSGKEYNEIEKNLYLGSDVPIKDMNLNKCLAVSLVVSVTEKAVPLEQRMSGVDYIHVEAGDFPDQDLISSFDICFNLIDTAIKIGKVVYVHCGGGLSRSATIVLAYMMKKYELSFTNALVRVNKKRKVFPNEGFVEQLRLYESMRFMIDGYNDNYRRFLLKTLTYQLGINAFDAPPAEVKFATESNRKQMLRLVILKYEGKCVREYRKKIEDAEQSSGLTDRGRALRCYYCRSDLFHEINIIGRMGGGSKCRNIFIEPLESYSTHADGPKKGYLKCPTCLIPFGSYNWLLYQSCCLMHDNYRQCLAIKVFPNKIF